MVQKRSETISAVLSLPYVITELFKGGARRNTKAVLEQIHYDSFGIKAICGRLRSVTLCNELIRKSSTQKK